MTILLRPAADGAVISQHGLSAISAETAFVDAASHRPVPGGYGHAVSRTDAQNSAGEPAVDIMALLGRCLGNFELIVRVLARFRKTGGADLEQMRCAIERSDFAAVVEISHRFKGAAGNISAASLHRIAAAIEQLSREQNAQDLPALLSQLADEWDKFLRYADAFAPTVGAPQVHPVV
jgi:HPt (histidine-containing phosphotransfer) domain-containing protein